MFGDKAGVCRYYLYPCDDYKHKSSLMQKVHFEYRAYIMVSIEWHHVNKLSQARLLQVETHFCLLRTQKLIYKRNSLAGIGWPSLNHSTCMVPSPTGVRVASKWHLLPSLMSILRRGWVNLGGSVGPSSSSVLAWWWALSTWRRYTTSGSGSFLSVGKYCFIMKQIFWLFPKWQ